MYCSFGVAANIKERVAANIKERFRFRISSVEMDLKTYSHWAITKAEFFTLIFAAIQSEIAC